MDSVTSAARAPLPCGERLFALGERTLIMGVVNITPDSFSDGGRYLEPVAAYDHAQRLLDEGADVIDLGAQSTRPGASPIGADEELRRLVPVLERLVAAGVGALSVDTDKASVAAAALQLGAAWINDVSGLADSGLAAACRGAQALVVMHHRAMRADRPEDDVRYGDVVGEVVDELGRLCQQAEAAGLKPSQLIVDPGIGFGKSVADNVALLRRCSELAVLGRPVLVGPSRKRFLSVLSGADSAREKDEATVGACCLAASNGADIVRVHNVGAVRRALAIVDAGRRP